MQFIASDLIIAENIYSQVGQDGHRYMLMEAITDHVMDETAIQKADGYTTNANGVRRKKITINSTPISSEFFPLHLFWHFLVFFWTVYFNYSCF